MRGLHILYHCSVISVFIGCDLEYAAAWTAARKARVRQSLGGAVAVPDSHSCYLMDDHGDIQFLAVSNEHGCIG